MQALIKDLNQLYKSHPAFYKKQFEQEGFQWLEINDYENSVLAYIRKAEGEKSFVIVCNMTPVVRENYRVGLPSKGKWKEVLNSDHEKYGGSNITNGIITVDTQDWHGQPFSAALKLPPLAVIVLA